MMLGTALFFRTDRLNLLPSRPETMCVHHLCTYAKKVKGLARGDWRGVLRELDAAEVAAAASVVVGPAMSIAAPAAVGAGTVGTSGIAGTPGKARTAGTSGAVGAATGKPAQPMTVYMYTACVTSLSKCGRWREALETLDRMTAAGITPTSHAISATITACGKGGQAQAGLDLLERMRSSGALEPELYCLSAAIDAAGREGRWEAALALLGDLRKAGIKPDKFVYRYVIRWWRELDKFSHLEQIFTRRSRSEGR